MSTPTYGPQGHGDSAMNREQIAAAINIAAEKLDLTRSAETTDTDAVVAATAELSALRERLAAFDATEARPPVRAERIADRPKTLGQHAEDLMGRLASGSGQATVSTERADIWTGSGGTADVVVPDFSAGIDGLPASEDAKFLSLFPSIPTASDTVTTFVQSGFTNNAAGTARRASGDFVNSPASDVTTAKKTVSVASISHTFRSDKASLSDSSALDALIRLEGPAGIQSALVAQVLATSDVANGVSSIAQTGTGRAQAHGAGYVYDDTDTAATGVQILTVIRQLKTLARLAQIPATVVAMSPEARELLDLAAVSTGFLTGPYVAGATQAWGLQIVDLDALSPEDSETEGAGRLIVMGTSKARFRPRTSIELSVSENVNDDFLSGAVTFRFIQRILLENLRPEAVAVAEATIAV